MTGRSTEKERKEPNPGDSGPSRQEPEDASRREIWLYAFGDAESSFTHSFFPNLQKIMIVAMQVNPLLIGFIDAITSLWESIAGPLVANASDNARGRWGRRMPFILFGGFGRCLVLLAIALLLPLGAGISRNSVMEAQRVAKEAGTEIADLRERAGELMEADAPEESEIEDFRSDAGEFASDLDRALRTLADEFARRSDEGEDTEPVVSALRLAEEASDSIRDLRDDVRDDAIDIRLPVFPPPVPDVRIGAGESSRILPGEPPARRTIPNTQSPFAALVDGWQSFWKPEASAQRGLVLYVLISSIVFLTLHKFFGVPYYGLGLEICPSYHGRTRVVTYRKAIDKVGSLVSPWLPVFCFSLIFTHAVEGLFWIAVAAVALGIPTTLVLCFFVKERPVTDTKKRKQQPGFFRSFGALTGNRHMLRLLAIHLALAVANGTFSGIGFLLNTYWVMGSALAASKLGVGLAMLGWALGLIALPVIQWACGRYQKHRVLAVSFVLMIIGSALKWWAIVPDHPEYQFILPFFFSLGIGTVYTVLMTMLSDIADVDELEHGVRREAMLGAVMASLMKISRVFVPVLGGAVLIMSGFDAGLEYEQTDATIQRMRFLHSWVPAALLVIPLLLVLRYPLTREQVEMNKEDLREMRKRE